MSGHQYITNPDNLFEDDIDDETFLRNSNIRQQSTNPFEIEENTNPFQAELYQTYEQKRADIEARTLDSTQRSLGLLYETEEVGKATATELAKQREQLEKSNRQLDEINATLRFSQKHLNGLKSVFGGLKNYLSGNRGGDFGQPMASGSTVINSPTNENKMYEPDRSPEDKYNTHPLTQIRDDNKLKDKIIESKKSRSSAATYEQRIENNLDEMCGNLSKLKFLATDLQTEIQSQNDLIDNMNYKIEDVDVKVSKQNKEMNKLLGKK